MSAQKKLVKLIYYLNHEESTVSFDPNNKLSVLKTLINLTQKINLDNYEILYGKKKISWDEDKPLKEYTGKDSVPVFYLKKREFIVQPSNNNISANDVNNMMYTRKNSDMGTNKSNSNGNKCRVSIDFFPSRTEIYTLLDNFLETNQLKKDYESDNKGTGVEITFRNSDVAYDFVKFINYEKMTNPLYKKIRTNLVFDTKGKDNRSPNQHKSIQSPDIQRRIKNVLESPQKMETDFNPDNSFKLNSSNSIRQHASRNGSREGGSRAQTLIKHSKGKSMDLQPRKLLQERENSRSIRISQPYGKENDVQFHDYLKNKEKWLDRKGIVPVIGKPKSNFISKGIINYDIPYGKPAQNHNFRDYYGTEVVIDDGKYYAK